MMRRAFFVLGIISIFIVRFISYEHIHGSQIPDDWFDRTITVTGIITDDPDRGLEKTTSPLTPLLQGEGNRTVTSKILLKMQNGTSIAYGDEVSVTGTIKHPENFMTDTDREFDYVNYLKVHDIYGLMNVSRIEIISHHNKSLFVEKLFRIKNYFVSAIKNLFPKNEAGLFAGIIIGEKSLLPKDVLGDFQIAGLTHMIVLSGYNITIIASCMITFLAYLGLGYRGRRVGAMVAIPIFLVMTGLGASSVRAGIMSLILFLLQITTRPAHSLRIILYTAGVMIFMNPRILLHDPGFHLSFLAFIGLSYVTPIMNSWLNKNESEFFLKKLMIETFSVQVFVLPYILWMSGRVSLLLLVSNILTVPFVPVIMAGGFVVTMIGIVLYPLGAMLAVPIKLGLSYIIAIAHWVASMKVVTFVIPPFGVWVMTVIYVLMMGYLIWWNRKYTNTKNKTPIKINSLTKLINEFIYVRPRGSIENPDDIINISKGIYFTRKSLKHFVDSRRSNRNSYQEMHYLMEKILEVLEVPDLKIKNPNQRNYPGSMLLAKYYGDVGKAVIVILDKKFVVTTYFKKRSDFERLMEANKKH